MTRADVHQRIFQEHPEVTAIEISGGATTPVQIRLSFRKGTPRQQIENLVAVLKEELAGEGPEVTIS